MVVWLWENMNLEKQEGFMDGPPTPLAVNTIRSQPPRMEEAGVLLLSKKETGNVRISHPAKERHQEAE